MEQEAAPAGEQGFFEKLATGVKKFFSERKPLVRLVGGFILLMIGVLWLVWSREQTKVDQEEAKKEEITEFQGEVEKLQEVEEQIADTKKRLEELSSLSPEEKKKIEEEREILSAQKAGEDVKINGVSVTVQGKKKIIVNNAAGYRIEVPTNLVIARSITSDWLELHDQTSMCLDPSCDPVIRIRASEANPNELPLDEWFAEEEKKAGAPVYSPRESKVIQGETIYLVREEVLPLFDGYYYYWSRGKKIYDIRISLIDLETYKSSIETFTPSPAQ